MTELSSPSGAAQVFERLRTAVLTLELLPGERLTERGVEAAFGASRTPVRAALARLEGEGLVRREGRGWRVAPIDIAEVHALAELRAALEPAAVRLAASRLRAEAESAGSVVQAEAEPVGSAAIALAGLSQQLDRMRPSTAPREESSAPAALEAGSRFHVELAALSGNAPMTEAIQGAMTRLARTRYLEVRTPESSERAWVEHRAVLDALLAGDAEGAAALIERHIRETDERLVAFLTAERTRFRASGLAVEATPA